MVMLIPNSQFDSIRHVFDSNQHMRNIIEAIPKLTKGELWIDNLENPLMALYTMSGIHFLAGTPDPNKIDNFLTKIPPKQSIFIPTQKEWVLILKKYFGDKLGNYNRFALSASSLTLRDIRNLKQELPYGFYVREVDPSILNQIKDSIGFYILLFFGDTKTFMASGKGYCILCDDEVISIASSLVPFTKSLEIQVDTMDSSSYRRKGFATRVAVEIIEYCLETGIEPHWDADNDISRDFALKLGYSNPQSYTSYYWV